MSKSRGPCYELDSSRLVRGCGLRAFGERACRYGPFLPRESPSRALHLLDWIWIAVSLCFVQSCCKAFRGKKWCWTYLTSGWSCCILVCWNPVLLSIWNCVCMGHCGLLTDSIFLLFQFPVADCNATMPSKPCYHPTSIYMGSVGVISDGVVFI